MIVGTDCDMPRFRSDHIDGVVWDWVKSFLSDPLALENMLVAYREEQAQAHKPVLDRLRITEGSIEKNRSRLVRLIDLYLDGVFPRDALIERKNRFESTIGSLEKERSALVAQLEGHKMTADKIQTLHDFAIRVADGLEYADQVFEARRKIIDTLDVRVTGALEDEQKTVYARCVIPDEVLSIDPRNTVSFNLTRSERPLRPHGGQVSAMHGIGYALY